MRKIRVLVVDDMVVFRRLVTNALNSDPDLEVVGTAANGRIALAKVEQLDPDLVILDIEMPEMDGLAALVELRKSRPRLPIIMFSAFTELGAAKTLEALSLGAMDYFTKPSQVGGLDASLQILHDQLIPEIKSLCGGVNAHEAVVPQVVRPAKVPVAKHPAEPQPVGLVAIGASTGGPTALTAILTGLPADFPVPIVVVQHMLPLFTRTFAERLDSQCRLRVREVVPGASPRAGEVWIAPGDFHLALVNDGALVRLLLHQDPPENSCRPSVDVLFRSAARTLRSGVLAVVLTGMGNDGQRGCEAVRDAGGQVVAQDEASSVVWGMPGSVVHAGLADEVLPLELIGAAVTRRVRARGGEPLGSGARPVGAGK